MQLVMHDKFEWLYGDTGHSPQLAQMLCPRYKDVAISSIVVLVFLL